MINEEAARKTLRSALEDMGLLGAGHPLPEPYDFASGVAGRSLLWFLALSSKTGTEVSIVAKFDEPERSRKEWRVIEELRGLNTPLAAILPMAKNKESHGVVVYQNLAALTLSGSVKTLGAYLAAQLHSNCTNCRTALEQAFKTLRVFYHAEPGAARFSAKSKVLRWGELLPVRTNLERIKQGIEIAWPGLDCGGTHLRIPELGDRPLPNAMHGLEKRLSEHTGRVLFSRIHGDLNLTNVMVGLDGRHAPAEVFIIDLAESTAHVPTAIDLARLESEFWHEAFTAPGSGGPVGDEDKLAMMVALRDVLDGREDLSSVGDDPYAHHTALWINDIRSEAQRTLGQGDKDYVLGDYMRALHFAHLRALAFQSVQESRIKSRLALLGAALTLQFLLDLGRGRIDKPPVLGEQAGEPEAESVALHQVGGHTSHASHRTTGQVVQGPLFSQPNQKVRTQYNIAGNATITVAPEKKAMDASASAKKTARSRKSKSPGAKSTSGKKLGSRDQGPSSVEHDVGGFGPELPDPLCVVFCRICGMDTKETHEMVAAVKVLSEVCSAVQGTGEPTVRGTYPSVYGRFLIVDDPVSALKAALQVVDRAAGQGVHLAVGVRMGRAEWAPGLGEDTLIGPPINLAARLAAMEKAASRIVVGDDIFQAVTQDRDFPPTRFDGPFSGTVKNTSMQYYTLIHSPGSYGNLPSVEAPSPVAAHVVVFDLVGFSAMGRDDQWESVTRLWKKAREVLGPIGGQQRVKDGHLWCAPAGDGGALVFSPDEAGGDTAWVFARDFALKCASNKLAIRTGVATDTVVVAQKELPVGKGILRADQLSGYPERGGICVNRAFWRDRPDDQKSQWIPSPVPEDPDALELMPLSAGSFAKDESRSAKKDAETVYRHVVERVRKMLSQAPELRDELQNALRGKGSPAMKSAADIVEIIFGLAMDEVLEAIHGWLEDQHSRDDVHHIRDVLDALVPLGVDPAWVHEARAGLSLDGAKGLRRGGVLAVPRHTEMSSAEVLKAAIMDAPCFWEKEGKGPLPVGSCGFEAGAVEPPGITLRSRLDEFRSHLLKLCAIQDDADARRRLEEHLEVLWKQKKPYYVLFGQSDELAGNLGGYEAIPWRYVLVMQKEDADRDILPKPRGVAKWLKDILDRLSKIGPGAK